MPVRSQPTPCLLCGAPTRIRLHASTAFSECPRCGYASLAASEQRPDYWPSVPDPASLDDFWGGAKRKYFTSALMHLEHESPGRRLLDIGGGAGYFAEFALRRGWDAYSLDISATATAIAAQRLGASRALTRVPDEAAGSFDVVTLWCVIAHTRQPAELMALAVRALRPGGMLWLTTPNFSFQKPYATLLSLLRKPVNFAAQDHVGHFTPSALRTLLARNGLASITFCYQGITEKCCGGESTSAPLLRLKRLWNGGAFAASRCGIPLYVSELQALARLRT